MWLWGRTSPMYRGVSLAACSWPARDHSFWMWSDFRKEGHSTQALAFPRCPPGQSQGYPLIASSVINLWGKYKNTASRTIVVLALFFGRWESAEATKGYEVLWPKRDRITGLKGDEAAISIEDKLECLKWDKVKILKENVAVFQKWSLEVKPKGYNETCQLVHKAGFRITVVEVWINLYLYR